MQRQLIKTNNVSIKMASIHRWVQAQLPTLFNVAILQASIIINEEDN